MVYEWLGMGKWGNGNGDSIWSDGDFEWESYVLWNKFLIYLFTWEINYNVLEITV